MLRKRRKTSGRNFKMQRLSGHFRNIIPPLSLTLQQYAKYPELGTFRLTIRENNAQNALKIALFLHVPLTTCRARRSIFPLMNEIQNSVARQRRRHWRLKDDLIERERTVRRRPIDRPNAESAPVRVASLRSRRRQSKLFVGNFIRWSQSPELSSSL